MPIRIRRVKGGYRVTDGGRVTAKRTSRGKAEAQARILRGAARRATKHPYFGRLQLRSGAAAWWWSSLTSARSAGCWSAGA